MSKCEIRFKRCEFRPDENAALGASGISLLDRNIKILWNVILISTYFKRKGDK
jgi:hypothetical protein